MQQPDLTGQMVLVTGAARRVGRTIALTFAQHGANLIIHHHASPDEAESTRQEALALGVEAIVCQADQSDPQAVARLFGEIDAHYGQLDVLVNSAAIFKQTPLVDVSFEEWQQVIGVNLTGPWLCTQAAARRMMAQSQGGSIINISDNSGLRPWKSRPHHSISKAGVIMLTKAAALALGEHNIRVNCVVPGPVLAPPDEDPAHWQQLVSRLPLGRDGAPQDVARACLFLATNDFVTGAVLNVDGGEAVT